jgi:anti-sigma B factor antagonist
MTGDLSIAQREQDGWVVLSLAGRVDLGTFLELEERLSRIAEEGVLLLRLEMQGLTSINSTGLGLLMAIHRHLRAQGGRLEIHGLSTETTSVFNLLGMARLMDDGDGGAAGVAARR